MDADTVYAVNEAITGGRRFRQVRACFVREGHRCGKYLGASKTCFIACPDDESLETMVALISEKLRRHGIDAFVAVKERAYGQDIFCTKICGRIIESQFCIVILDDAPRGDDRVPNPNVYYEYGLMTALGKHVIPLQKKEEKLAFNIQSHDTVKYTSANLSKELDVAIKDALTRPGKADEAGEYLPAMAREKIGKAFELADYHESSTPTGPTWFSQDPEDAKFEQDTVFDCYEKSHPPSRIYFSSASDAGQVSDLLTDLILVSRRLGACMGAYSEDSTTAPEDSTTALENPTQLRRALVRSACFAVALSGEAAEMGPRLKEEFEKANVGPHRFKLHVTSGDEITIGTEKISLSLPKLI